MGSPLNQEAPDFNRGSVKKKITTEVGPAENFVLPWIGEDDFEQWEEDGYICLMTRHPELLHWRGYVGIPQEKLNLLGPLVLDSIDEQNHNSVFYKYTTVHGGIIYCEKNAPDKFQKPSPQDLYLSSKEFVIPSWWIGFDCAHSCDLAPGELLIYEGKRDLAISGKWKMHFPEELKERVFKLTKGTPGREIQSLNHYWTQEKVRKEVKSLKSEIDMIIRRGDPDAKT